MAKEKVFMDSTGQAPQKQTSSIWKIVGVLVILALLFGLDGMRSIVGGAFGVIFVILLIVGGLLLIFAFIDWVSPKNKEGKKDYSWLYIVALIGIIGYCVYTEVKSQEDKKYLKYDYAYWYTSTVSGEDNIIIDGTVGSWYGCDSKASVDKDYLFVKNRKCGRACKLPIGYEIGKAEPTCEEYRSL